MLSPNSHPIRISLPSLIWVPSHLQHKGTSTVPALSGDIAALPADFQFARRPGEYQRSAGNSISTPLWKVLWLTDLLQFILYCPKLLFRAGLVACEINSSVRHAPSSSGCLAPLSGLLLTSWTSLNSARQLRPKVPGF